MGSMKNRSAAATERDHIIEILRSSGLIDERWYLQTYSDVAKGCIDPVEHYVDYGASEGRNPNSHFDTKWYLSTYIDVKEAGVNPLLHYLLTGAQEGRRVGQTFDTAYYLAHNPDVDIRNTNPLVHFLRYGLREGRVGRSYPFTRDQQ